MVETIIIYMLSTRLEIENYFVIFLDTFQFAWYHDCKQFFLEATIALRLVGIIGVVEGINAKSVWRPPLINYVILISATSQRKIECWEYRVVNPPFFAELQVSFAQWSCKQILMLQHGGDDNVDCRLCLLQADDYCACYSSQHFVLSALIRAVLCLWIDIYKYDLINMLQLIILWTIH